MDRATIFMSAFGKPVQIGMVIIISEKYRLTAIAALDNMGRLSRQIKSGFSWHVNVLVRYASKQAVLAWGCLRVLTPFSDPFFRPLFQTPFSYFFLFFL